MHRFPDEEAHLRTASTVSGRPVVIAAALDHVDKVLLPERLAAGQNNNEAGERLLQEEAVIMASMATRSVAKRRASIPCSVRQTTGSPVSTRPTEQVSRAGAASRMSARNGPVRMKQSAAAGRRPTP